MRFKKGDEVIIVKNKSMGDKWSKYNDIVGKLVTITEIYANNNSNATFIVDNNKYGINFKKDCFRSKNIKNWKKELEI